MRTARPQPHKSPAALAYAITHSPRTLQHNYPPPDTNELGPATCSKLITAQHGPPPIKTMTAFVPLPPPTNRHCPQSWCRSHLLIFNQNWNQTHPDQFVLHTTVSYANARGHVCEANTKHFGYNWWGIAKAVTVKSNWSTEITHDSRQSWDRVILWKLLWCFLLLLLFLV